MDNKNAGLRESDAGLPESNEGELNKVVVPSFSGGVGSEEGGYGETNNSADVYNVDTCEGNYESVVSGANNELDNGDTQETTTITSRSTCCQHCLEKDRLVEALERRNIMLERSYEVLRSKMRKTHEFLRYLAEESEAVEVSLDTSSMFWSSASSVTHVDRPVNHEAPVTPFAKTLKRNGRASVTSVQSSSLSESPEKLASSATARNSTSSSAPTSTSQTSAMKMDLASAQQYDLKPLVPGGTLYVSEVLRETSIANAGQSRKKLARILTRQLFSEETLANSSVRGQTNKPGLDPAVINDIIKYCMADDTLSGAPAVSSKDIVVSLNALCGEHARKAVGKSEVKSEIKTDLVETTPSLST